MKRDRVDDGQHSIHRCGMSMQLALCPSQEDNPVEQPTDTGAAGQAGRTAPDQVNAHGHLLNRSMGSYMVLLVATHNSNVMTGGGKILHQVLSHSSCSPHRR